MASTAKKDRKLWPSAMFVPIEATTSTVLVQTGCRVASRRISSRIPVLCLSGVRPVRPPFLILLRGASPPPNQQPERAAPCTTSTGTDCSTSTSTKHHTSPIPGGRSKRSYYFRRGVWLHFQTSSSTSSTDCTMTIVATEDSRNLEWRKSNVGSAMLQKMGWKEGQAIGKRSDANTHALRAVRRQDGLGLGAKIESQGGDSERSDHFASVLQHLQTHHKPSKKNREAKSKKTKLTLAQNRVNAGHARKLREAKFGAKSAEDLACIFGKRDLKLTEETPEPAHAVSSEEDEQESKKRKKKAEKKNKKTKKRKTESDS
jgi:hypothetical protein